jgi:hypothetical protein
MVGDESGSGTSRMADRQYRGNPEDAAALLQPASMAKKCKRNAEIQRGE